jgi:hypothetical protein
MSRNQELQLIGDASRVLVGRRHYPLWKQQSYFCLGWCDGWNRTTFACSEGNSRFSGLVAHFRATVRFEGKMRVKVEDRI